MPFLGLATTSDVEKAVDEAATSLRADMKKAIDKASQCTQLVSGVHLCSHPKHAKVYDPQDFKLSQLVIPDTGKACVRFDHIPDLVGPSPTAQAVNGMVGHGDIPDNYLCFDAKMTTQYFDAVIPAPMKPLVLAGLSTTTMHKALSENVHSPRSSSKLPSEPNPANSALMDLEPALNTLSYY